MGITRAHVAQNSFFSKKEAKNIPASLPAPSPHSAPVTDSPSVGYAEPTARPQHQLLFPQHEVNHRIHISDIHIAVTSHVTGGRLPSLPEHHVNHRIHISDVDIVITSHVAG